MNFEQFNFETSENNLGKGFQLEKALSPEAEIDFDKGKKVLAEIWPSLVGSERIKENEIEGLSSKEYRSLLYEKMKPSLGKTIESLGISANNELLSGISDKKELSEKQIEIIKKLEKQFKDISVGGKLKDGENDTTWNFYPEKIIKDQSVNCSGASLLFGYIAENLGIKSYQARVANHAFNILELADGRLVYVDTRINSSANDSATDSMRSFVIDRYSKQELGGVEIIDIKASILDFVQRTYFHKKVLLLPQFEAVVSIIDNFGELKSNAAQGIISEEKVKEIEDSSDGIIYNHSLGTRKEAEQVYIEKQQFLARLNFNALYDNLCGDIKKIEEDVL